MKQINSFFYFGLILLFMLALPSCAKKIAFLNSSVVPAAEGNVSLKTDKNKNYSLDMHIYNLAEPERLQPPGKIYIVWMETDQNMTKNIGQIKTSTGTFSKGLKATFQTVTSTKPTKIFITAKDDPNTQVPNWKVVLTTSNF